MALSTTTYALSKKYTDKSIEGLGAIKGADCRIESVTPTGNGNIVVFSWTGTSGTKETTSLNVKNGTSITKVTVDNNNNLIIDFSDGTSITAGNIKTIKGDKGDTGDTGKDGFSPTVTITESTATHTVSITDVNGVKSFIVKDGTPEDMQNYYTKTEINSQLNLKADKTEIPTVPTNLSAFNNDTNFINNTINNLVNYYNKTETYTKSEVNTLISNINKLTTEIVETLPTSSISTTTIYLVPVSGKTDVYSQYMYINSAWALLGETTIDLTNFYTKAETDNKLDAKADKSAIPTVPTNVSSFTNDAGYITEYTETDPTVPAWAKEATKPTYTAQEVGALPDDTVIPVFTNKTTLDKITESDVTNWNNASSKAHEHNNKEVLDKFSDVNGTVLYNGSAISGGGASIDDTTTTAIDKTWSAKHINETKADKIDSNNIKEGQVLIDDGNGNIDASGKLLSEYIPAWSGTKTEWENLDKTNIADKTIINITDDYTEGSSSSIQVKTMPETANIGDIVQYIGDTTESYTNGYFYKWSISSNGTTYLWKNIAVMPSSSSGGGNASIDDSVISETKTWSSTKINSSINNSIAQANFLTDTGFGNLRYYNGYLQYYDTNTSTWVDTSVTPDNVYILNIMPQAMKRIIGIYDIELGHYKLKWEEPDDTVVDNQVVCLVEKVVIRRKLGSVPENEEDGDLVVEIKRKDFGLYKNSYYVDETLSPTLGDNYYYKAFPMSTTGFYNTSSLNEINILCKDYYLYGFRIDQNESDPNSMITYLSDCDNTNYISAKMDYTLGVFDYGDWKDAWFIKNLKPCMLKYNGTVDYELDKNDYTKKVDGSDSDISNPDYEGNAMVGVPKVYWKIVDNNNDTANIYICSKRIDDDFHCWSHIDNNGNEIDYCYMSIYCGSPVNNVLRSLSDRPYQGDLSGSTEVTYATANNQTEDIIWYTEVFSDRMLINILLLLLGKSTASQTIFGTGNSQTSSTIIGTGTMNTKGLFWGSDDTTSGVKIFGMENWWSNQWRRVAGYVVDNGTQKVKMTYGQLDGSTTNGYNSTGEGYISISGSTADATSGDFISKMLFTPYGLIPIKATGSATTYYTDGLWFAKTSIYYLLCGGRAGFTYASGALVMDLSDSFSYYATTICTALSCKPLASIM